MTHIRIVINDVVEFDGDPGDWQQKPPDLFRDVITPTAAPRPWLKAVALAMHEAVLTQVSTSIEVKHRSNRWEMKVEIDA